MLMDNARAKSLISMGAQGVLSRLALCQDLQAMEKRKKTPQETTAEEIRAQGLIKRRKDAIRAQLLPSWKEGKVSEADALLVPSMAGPALREFLAGAASASEGRKVQTGLMVTELLALLKKVESDEMALGLVTKSTPMPGVLDEAHALIPPIDADAPEFIRAYMHGKAIAEESIEAGRFSDQLKSHIEDAASDIDVDFRTLDSEKTAVMYKLAIEHSHLHAKINELVAKLNRAKARSSWEKLKARYDKLVSQRQQVYEKWKEINGPLVALQDQIKEENEARGKAARLHIQQQIDDDVEASDIDAEAGAAWSSEQDITPDAAQKLEAMGYGVEKVRQDMAQCYRFLRGRVEKLKIVTTENKRAWAMIGGHGEPGLIAVGKNFDKRVLWHEMGHHVEADPAALAAAKYFIRYRATSPIPQKLNDLLPGSNYEEHEIAFIDHFFDPYAGKDYAQGATEIFSMGVEAFSSPEKLALFLKRDPQTVEFVRGYLKSPMDMMQRLHLSMRQSARQVKETGTAEIKQTAPQRIEALALEGFKVVTGWEWGKQYPGSSAYYTVNNYYAPSMKMVGMMDIDGVQVYIAQGKVRDSNTKRLKSGYMMFFLRQSTMPGSQPHNQEIERSFVDTKDATKARAIAALWAKSLKSNPNSRPLHITKLEAGEF